MYSTKSFMLPKLFQAKLMAKCSVNCIYYTFHSLCYSDCIPHTLIQPYHVIVHQRKGRGGQLYLYCHSIRVCVCV